MRTRRPSAATTFIKYDKVNGRSYKTIRSKPRVGPTPEVMHTIVQPKKAVQSHVSYDEPEEEEVVDYDTKSLDGYSDISIEESVDSDGVASWEASFMRGQNSA